MALISQEERLSFRDNGFLILRNLIPPELVRAARRGLNAAIGREGARNTLFREYADAHSADSFIADLLVRTNLLPVVRELVSPEVIADPSAQIAIRFPQIDDPTQAVDYEASPERLVRMTPHIDGIKLMPHIDLPEPVQVQVSAGDVVLAHYLLGHGVGRNLSPYVRYTVYFRGDHPSRANLARPLPPSSRERVNIPFTSLMGVQLSDLNYDNGGNLVVWPGSHNLYADYYRNHLDEARDEFVYTDFLDDIWAEWDGIKAVA